MPRNLSPTQLIERSIQKKYRKELWTPFILAVKRYALIQAGDRVAVCVSGGKDSMLLAKLMQLLQRFSDVPFEVKFLAMDPGYAPANRRRIEENARLLGIPLEIFETDVFDVANAADKNPCYLCARMRRGHLYSNARALGCNKIALGHHINDVIETTSTASTRRTSSPGSATITWNFCNAPAGSQKPFPRAATAWALRSARRSSSC